MDEAVRASMQVVVDYLDKKMQEKPDRALADTSNYLQDLLDKDAAK